MLTYDDYMKQQKACCDALESIKKELAQKRSELANHAKKTVNDLEPAIADKQAKLNIMNAEITRLNSIITTKSRQADSDENYWKCHYSELESKLNKAHDARTATINAKDDQYDSQYKAHLENVADLQKREQDLKNGQNKLSELYVIHQQHIDLFEKNKLDHESKVKNIMEDLNGHINDANSEVLKQKSITDNLETKQNDLIIANQKAQETMDRIKEAQIKFDAAQKLTDAAYTKEQENKKGLEQLESARQELKDKNTILAKRSSRLDQQEAVLHQRIRHICTLEEQKQLEKEAQNGRGSTS